MGDFIVHGRIISPYGGEEKSTIIDVKYTDARISRFFRDDLQNSGEYATLTVVIAFIVALASAIMLIIIFINP